MSEKVLSVTLDEREERIVVRRGSRGRPTVEEYIELRASGMPALRTFLSRFGLFDVATIDFDDRTGKLVDPPIVGQPYGEPQERPPAAPYEYTPSPRWTERERERHGERVSHGARSEPKPPVELVLGDLDQVCGRCERREAAANYCTQCAASTGPETWYDRAAYQRASIARASAARARGRV